MGNEIEPPVVWVVQENNNDYSPAELFGTVKFITRNEYRSVENSQQNEQVISDVRNFVSSYVPGHDYIVPVGNPIVIALVVLSLGSQSHTFLKWDRRRGVYVPHTISTVKGQ